MTGAAGVEEIGGRHPIVGLAVGEGNRDGQLGVDVVEVVGVDGFLFEEGLDDGVEGGPICVEEGFTVVVGFVDEGGDGAVDLGFGFVRGKVVAEGVELR